VQDRSGDVFWLLGLFGSLLAALAIFPLNVNHLKEN
jgi:hypothetical protein